MDLKDKIFLAGMLAIMRSVVYRVLEEDKTKNFGGDVFNEFSFDFENQIEEEIFNQIKK